MTEQTTQQLPMPTGAEQAPVTAQVEGQVDPARANQVGARTVRLVEMPDGSFATADEVAEWQKQGHNLNEGPYKNGVR